MLKGDTGSQPMRTVKMIRIYVKASSFEAFSLPASPTEPAVQPVPDPLVINERAHANRGTFDHDN